MKREVFTKKYLIITTQRTGSSWLVDMLSSNQQIASYPELFRLLPETNYPSYGYSDIMFYEKWSKSRDTTNFIIYLKKIRANIKNILSKR
jgi:LPS sulfotransferase NodH